MKLQSLKILLTLLGWLTIQSMVLGHEFSEEHLSSSNGHVCLTQAVNLDELIPASGSSLSTIIELEYSVSEPCEKNTVYNRYYSSHQSRGPPLNS
jgi:hypothetical protein